MDEFTLRITPTLHIISVIDNHSITFFIFTQFYFSFFAQFTILFQGRHHLVETLRKRAYLIIRKISFNGFQATSTNLLTGLIEALDGMRHRAR